MSRSLDEMREDFPILQHRTYLASHSLGAVPRAAKDVLEDYYTTWATQGILAWDGDWWNAVDHFAGQVERLLGAEGGTVVPMQNATRAMAGVASCFDWSGERNKVVLTDREFTTSYPLWRSLEDLGAEVQVVSAEEEGQLPTQALVEAVDRQTRLVPTCHVFFRSGAIQDLVAVTKAAHEQGAYVLADGYQAVGTVPVDVQALGVDFYVGGSHKWLCGGPGAGFLYVRPEVVGRIRPRLTGWFGLDEPFSYEMDTGRGKPHPTARRFLDGTPNVPGLYAAKAGLDAVLEAGMDRIRRKGKRLSQAVVEEVQDRGWTLISPEDPEARSAMVCFRFDGSSWKAKRLAEQGVIADARPDAGMRVSTHFYNDNSDLETFWKTLDEV